MCNILAVLMLFLLALPAIAFSAPNTTHGQVCDSDITLMAKGRYNFQNCVNLCNNYAAADDAAECTEYEFRGIPDIIVLEKEENDSNCSANVTFTFTTGPVTGGAPSYDFDTIPVDLNDTTDRLVLIMEDGPLDAFLFTNVTSDDACTDVDVRMYLGVRRR